MKHEKQWKEASVQIVEPAVEAITEPDIWKRLELIGRVCYKSEHKITEDSALPFCEMLFSKRHLSVFEHGNITTIGEWTTVRKCIMEHPPSFDFTHFAQSLRDYSWHSDFHSFRFICDRGIANQLVRHKDFAFMQESTRYVKYDKCLPVIRPLPFKWASDPNNPIYRDWMEAMLKSVASYQAMVQHHGLSAQEARVVLPLSTKTELIMTGSKDQFARLYKVRSGSDCHPQMRYLMELFKSVVEAQGVEIK